jgi:glucose/arabinose dehydrogenase
VNLRRLVGLVAIAAVLPILAACAPDPARAAGTTELTSIGAGLRGPAGTTAAVYSYGPQRVSAVAFDAEGRLWLSTAASSDVGTDGVYFVARAGAVPLEVISGQHTPLGLLWRGGTLYVASADGVVAYTGFDGTAFTGHQTIVTLPPGVGEINAIVSAPDGRIWMGVSAPCDHCEVTSRYSASILSFRPDGSDLRVEVSGIRAAVGLAYYPGTSHLYASLDQRDDLGARTPGDWLVQVRSGQSWNFPDCYGQGGAVCRGVPAPVGVLDPHAGVDGVAIVTGQLGPSVGHVALVAEWATGKVEGVTLTPTGSAPPATVSTVLEGLKHPTALAVAPDGSVIVGDWDSGILYRIARS